ncbi:14068_t:CDS:1 [Funneliformis geosporum]|uniref:8935_t:CDS:1 n=1 Tax=Funneliformis geosporum TaxID=1117311 RepID=A0A9W4SC80_9GLOM|nr:8935_t:CDS:1 [Funneliformis geosporum]CAI2164461.1 14068_t:CDS:1 [Funneliformis geosporum]
MEVNLNFFEQRNNRKDIIVNYEKWLKIIERMPNKKMHHLITTNNFEYMTNSQSINIGNNLKNRISIANLTLDKVHVGRFLLCRVINRCAKLGPLFTLIEDPEGEIERIALYNWVEHTALPVKVREKVLSINQVSKFLPIGTKLAIKNPYYQVASSFDTLINIEGPRINTDFDSLIRSDVPDDVIIIDQDDERFNKIKWSNDLGKGMNVNEKDKVYKVSVDDEKRIGTPDECHQKGNKYFISNDFAQAVDEYSTGIRHGLHNATLLANRAEAYLRLDRFKKALNDVEKILKRDPGHMKAAIRKGKALIGLKSYQESIITLKDLNLRMQTKTECDDNLITSIKQSVKELLKRAEMFDSENRYGRYDYKSIIDEYCEKIVINQDNDDWACGKGPRLDHAEYLIDDIEIRHVKKKGRGWVAKRDIPEGTLVMVSKAFKVVYGNEAPLSFRSIDFTRGYEVMNTATHLELSTRIARELIAEPELCQEVYQLYAGPEMVPMEYLDEKSLHSVNMKRIEKIVKYNFFEPRDEWDILYYSGNDSRLTKDYGAGLWILPSYFNHSCVDINIQHIIIGDMMILRSCRPILKDEELILTYCSPAQFYEERSTRLKSYGINCQCRLCEFERVESFRTKVRRIELFATYEKCLGPQLRLSFHSPYFDPSLINELNDLIAESNELRKDLPDLNFLAYEPKSDLAMAYVKIGKLRQSLPITKQVYNFLKTAQLLHLTSNAAYQVASRYARLGQMKEANEWFDVTLKELAEPIRGKFNEDEIQWREEALHLAKKLAPKMIEGARNKGLV